MAQVTAFECPCSVSQPVGRDQGVDHRLLTDHPGGRWCSSEPDTGPLRPRQNRRAHGTDKSNSFFERFDLLLRRQLVAVRRKCFTISIAGTATGRILMTRTTRLSRRRGVCGQRVRRFRSGHRQRSASCQRRDNGSQDLQSHFSSPLRGTNIRSRIRFLARKI
jgi:hypothetical protein